MTTIKGVNNYTDISGSRNDIVDYSAVFRGIINNEGIINGMDVVETSPTSAAVNIGSGYFAIDNGNNAFLIFRLVDPILGLVIPNTGNPNKRWLIVGKVDTVNATIEVGVVESFVASVDPELTEGAGIYYIVLARITNDGVGNSDVKFSWINQRGTDYTNNSTPEIIGRTAGMNGWNRLENDVILRTDGGLPPTVEGFDVIGDVTNRLSSGDKLNIIINDNDLRQYNVRLVGQTLNTSRTALTVIGDALPGPADTVSEVFYSKSLNPGGWEQANSIDAKDGSPVKMKITRQDNTTNTEKDNSVIKTGWGYIQGDNTTNIFETVTFDEPFSEVPIILVSSGGSNTSIPTHPGDVNSSGRNINANATSDTENDFVIYLETTDGVNTTNTRYYTYKWIAIGQLL